MKKIFLILSLILSTSVFAINTEVKNIQDRWSVINYNTNEENKEKEFAKLLNESNKVVESTNKSVESLIWRGIVKSSYANAKGGLGALSIAEDSKNDFEEAIKLNPSALEGSAYTSLGVLYFKVPSWPIGFGDNKKAEELLLKGLELNPEGIDSNYFYAEFLYEKRKYKDSLKYIEKAKAAKPREGREVADNGRRKEIEELEKKLNKKIKS